MIIKTYAGYSLDIDNPAPSSISIDDIIHNLSLIPYRDDQYSYFSMASYNLYLYNITSSKFSLDVVDLKGVLFHNAAVAYIGHDFGVFPEYEKIHTRLSITIADALAFDHPGPAIIDVLKTLGNVSIPQMHPQDVEDKFYRIFSNIGKKLKK